MDAALTRFARLSELTATLADALSEEEVVSAVLEQGLEVLGASGAFVVLPAADAAELRLAGYRGYHDEVVQPWARIPLDARIPATAAYSEGRTVVVRGDEERSRRFPDQVPDPFAFSVLVAMPLRGRGGLLGVIGFSFADEQAWLTEQDVAYTEALADHCASAIERSQLFAEAVAARAAAERSAYRAALLQKVTSDLAQARTPKQVAEVLVHEGVVAADAFAGWVSLLDRDGTRLELVAEAGYPAFLVESFGSIDTSLPNRLVDWMRGAVPVWLESADALGEAFPTADALHRAGGLEAVAILPLVVGGTGRGFLAIDFTTPRSFDGDERALLETLATLCSQALERAWLNEELGARADAAAVLERIGEGVFQLDRQGRILIWNPAAARITGIPAEAALGLPIAGVLPGWERLAAAETERPREALRFELGGLELWLSFSAVHYGAGSVVAFRDLSEERALEEARRDFVATASHELRTPLSAVYGAALTLLRRDLPEERRTQLLSLIAAESERLSGILDELLLASRLDAGVLTLQVVECDAAAIAREVVELGRQRAPAGIELSIAPAAPARDGVGRGGLCLADPDRLRQVLVNLVDNAIKYSPAGGRVDVTVAVAGAPAGITAEAGAERLRITVADRGLGVPPAERERIFEKFARLDPGLSRGVGGTGLGLYICRRLVAGMGGRIGVDGRGPAGGGSSGGSGGGSVFWVELPLVVG